jgi:urate oxidase
VLYPARFGLHIAVHLLSRYAHLTTTYVTVEQLRWARIGTDARSDADGGGGGDNSEGHKHAFWRDGTERRFVEVELARKSNGDGAVARVAGGLRELLGALLSRFFSRRPLFHLWVVLWFHKRTHTHMHTQISIDR